MTEAQLIIENRKEYSFDTDALKTKYQEERERRLRNDGINQFRTVDEAALHHYVDDPYATAGSSRDPVEEEVDFLIIGGGFGGLLVAARLQEVGITNIRIVDKAADFGGTWYWNRYPGLSCDIESYIYMPLLEELKYIPTEKYAKGSEIFEYARSVGRHYDLYSKALLQTEVVSLDWDGEVWVANTDHKDCIRARFVATAGGVLHKPKLPGISGIELFNGHSFHTSRWDWDYTGGTTEGSLDNLKDKRIGIIGTGASAIQVVPHLAKGAQHLYVFQRTPSSVDIRLDQPTDPAWAEKMKSTPGWHKHRRDNFNILVTGGVQDEDLVSDGWTDILRKLASGLSGLGEAHSIADIMNMRQLADFEKMEQIRKRVDDCVQDPDTANKLKPWYNQFCKRPCFNNEYLEAFNRKNVTLVDTAGRKGVEHIDETGIVANGKHYDLDCIIYATGFEFSSDYSKRLSTTISGRDRLTLTDKWKDGMSTLYGLHTRGSPNLFIMSISQSGFTPAVTHSLDEQSQHIAYLTSQFKSRGIRKVEPSQEAEDEWTKTIIESAQMQRGFVSECTPGYYNMEGEISDKFLRNSSYGLGSPAFFKMLSEWRQEGQLRGLEVEYEKGRAPAVQSQLSTEQRI